MKITKKEASFSQIIAAIVHYESGELDCAITLAAAAEGMLSSYDKRYLFDQLLDLAKTAKIDLNQVINWLKHSGDPDSIDIREFEAAIAIARAITKFIAAYSQSTVQFENFLRHAHESGILPVRLYPISN